MLAYCTKCYVVFFGMPSKEPERVNGWLPYGYIPEYNPHCKDGQVVPVPIDTIEISAKTRYFVTKDFESCIDCGDPNPSGHYCPYGGVHPNEPPPRKPQDGEDEDICTGN